MPMSPSGEGTGLSIREGEFDSRHGRQFEFRGWRDLVTLLFREQTDLVSSSATSINFHGPNIRGPISVVLEPDGTAGRS